ncbi:MAG TPA: transcription termination/antitermination protein NusA, partial [Spirochaetia bacterium]|nr:transcription termination/antitermination protein NusA [Spirochaetia bacterium]
KALIHEVNKGTSGLQIVLSRTHTEFVKRIFELEVPEIYDHTVEVYKIVREPGYRTKIAVYSNRDDVDPVGACVGLRGVRIQAIVRELEGEKIDILKYDPDPIGFIKNALSPAEVLHVILLDEAKKQALAVVSDNQFSLAIGKQGLNVRLANRIADWNIDVKSEEQFAEMDISAETKKAVSALFGDYEEEEITRISELPGIPERVVEVLKKNKLDRLEDLVAMNEGGLSTIEGISDEDAKIVLKAIEENVEIIEETATEEKPTAEEGMVLETKPEEAAPSAQDEPSVVELSQYEPPQGTAPSESGLPDELTEDERAIEGELAEEQEGEEEVYECPECSTTITVDMTNCPNCGVGLSFEEEQE